MTAAVQRGPFEIADTRCQGLADQIEEREVDQGEVMLS
jgi:hypothetical protein